jgi:hypothetical protein
VSIRNEDGELILVRWRGSPCSRTKLRKEARCAECGGTMAVGEVAFRPIDNSLIRMKRVHVKCMERLA